ncbi:MAG TPA: 4-(cytidine 5'-diphospho)-2-C-methyl-D-erythritol kinase [Dehalococcoidales bacterium]|nr:4-(cytidine 5'-diphospho)-2-C-methyl-D-erythritol kinase [Dehalococcoidales bacterium]
MLTVLAPAKLNLTLEVLGGRPDGYHEVRSVIQTINLCDSLNFQLSRSVSIRSSVPDWASEKSLVSRAVSLLQETTGCSDGVSIEVIKRIPLMSGLGGDSSDAAATLRGLDKLWNLGLTREKLLDLAGQLGSDVVFFLYGGTALAEGRGEVVIPLPPLPRRWIVLVVPDVPRLPGKTKQLYASLNPGHYTDGQVTAKLVTALREGREFTPSLLFNTFENVAFTYFSGLNTYQEQLVKAGADNIHLAGSGPTLFSMVDDRTRAEEMLGYLEGQGVEAYLADTLSAVDQI